MITKVTIDEFIGNLPTDPDQDESVDDNTQAAYRNALNRFMQIVGEDAEMNTETFKVFLIALKKKALATQHQYKTAVMKYYRYYKLGNQAELEEVAGYYLKKLKTKEVNFERAEIEKVIKYCMTLGGDNLLDLRDRAFVLTLVDTGLRISEACALTHGDIDWQERRAMVTGKGGKSAVVRFSKRTVKALQRYFKERAKIDPDSKTPLALTPLFARHDKGARKKILPILPNGMWQAIKDRLKPAGVDNRKSVRIHDFRHYFVTMVYLGTNSDIKRAGEFARHASPITTHRYAHLGGDSDEVYDDIFNN